MKLWKREMTWILSVLLLCGNVPYVVLAEENAENLMIQINQITDHELTQNDDETKTNIDINYNNIFDTEFNNESITEVNNEINAESDMDPHNESETESDTSEDFKDTDVFNDFSDAEIESETFEDEEGFFGLTEEGSEDGETENTEVKDSGSCGTYLTWTLTNENVLIISGSGDMWEAEDIEWDKYKDEVTTLIIESGALSIEAFAFDGFSKLSSVTIPQTVEDINEKAFRDCVSLKSIVIPEGVLRVEPEIFQGCTSLTQVTFPESITGMYYYTDISYGLFTECTSLTDIYYNGSKTRWKNTITEISSRIPSTVKVHFAKADYPELSYTQNKTNGIEVGWEVVDKVTNYRVFYKTTDSDWKRGGDVSVTGKTGSFIVTGLTSGQTYIFTVRGLTTDRKKYSTEYKREGISGLRLDQPKITSMSCTEEGVVVKWDPVPGAQNYYVRYKSPYGWFVTQFKKNSPSCQTVLELTEGKNYTFSVEAFAETDDNSTFSSFDEKGKTITYEYKKQPVLKSAVNTNGGVEIKWSSVGAAKYRVFYKIANGSWKRAGDTTGSNYVVKGLTSGKTYSFTVRCLNMEGYYCSTYDKIGKSIKYLAVPAVKAVKASKGITVGWNKVSGASGYYIYRRTAGSKWSMIKKITSGSTIKYTDKTTQKGTTYYYTIRAYSGKILSSYIAKGTSAKAG